MLGVLLSLAATAAPPVEVLDRYEAAQTHMGTTFEIVLYASTKEQAADAFRKAFARIAEWDHVMSDYDSDSEVSRLSRTAATKVSMPLSNDLFKVLTAAKTLSGQTDGAFDVTIGPLTKLWRRARRRGEFPDPELLRQARAATGYQHLRLDQSPLSCWQRTCDLTLVGLPKDTPATRPCERW